MLSRDKRGTRDRSLDAAIQVLRDAGIDELTTRAIARVSGLTQPAIYRHFAGKDELVGEVLARIRDMVLERMEEASAIGDSRERLLATLGVFRDFAIEEPRLYDALFLQTGDRAPAPPPPDPGRGGSIFGILVARVTECARDGVITGSGPVATALSLAAHTQGLVLLYRQGRFASSERFREFYDRSLEEIVDRRQSTVDSQV